MRFDQWVGDGFAFNDDALLTLYSNYQQRIELIWKIQNDLAKLAAGLGQDATQIETKVDLLFSAFAAEWAIYTLTGSPAIVTAITDDITIPWLDTDVSGTTIRQRLLNRLS
jgi:hypothetical protein